MFNIFKKQTKFQILPDIGHSYIMTENGEPMPTFYRPNSGLFCSTPLSDNDIVYFLNIRRPILIDVENIAPIEIPSDLPKECDGIIFKNFGKYKITAFYVIDKNTQIMSDKITITTQSGEIVEAAAPVIISASRSTDIPAFYAQWFINRLRAGYCVWYNPFNQNPTYVSFQNCKVVVFWTKNPKPLLPLLHELDERGIHYYFQFTLNDYDNERFEPNVPSVEQRAQTFRQLSEMVGKNRVIWRFDPLIVTPQLSVRDLLTKVWNVGNKLKGFTDKLVFSFIDINDYRKVQNNLVKETNQFLKETIEQSEFTSAQMNEIADGLAKCRDRWMQEGWQIELATCAEKIDLDKYGIIHNRCIDGELMKRIWADDKDLLYYLNYGKLPDKDLLFGMDFSRPALLLEKMKDKGQRKICGCMMSKDIGMYNTCRHLCVYCYANTSKDLVLKNINNNESSESIIVYNAPKKSDQRLK